MDHLAQDLTVALEESESCGPISLDSNRKWGMRRRTRSAGNLHFYVQKSADNQSEDSSSSNSEIRHLDKNRTKPIHLSDSDDISFSLSVSRGIGNRSQSLRMKHVMQQPLFKGKYNRLGMSHSLESDSLNEHSPARPNLRRKRKLKRMSVDETPIPPCGKRKRPQRFEIIENGRTIRYNTKIKPLNQSLVDKIEKFCHPADVNDCNMMDTQYIGDNCDVASESSLSWSGGEGHEGDDELTDWAPPSDNASYIDQCNLSDDRREIRAGCRRLGDERPGFSISTSANERVAKFLQDSTRAELRLYGAEQRKLSQLATLYSLDLSFENPNSLVLRKTSRTPCMQPTQRHHTGHSAAHKRIRTCHLVNAML